MVVARLHDPTSVARAFLDARARGDVDAARGLVGDDVRWMSPVYGEQAGEAEFVEMQAEAFADTDWFASEVLSTEARGPRVLARVRNRGARHGRELDSEQLLILTVRDGLIRRVDICVDDPERVRRFWNAS